MTIIDRLRAIEKQLSEIWKLLMPVRASAGIHNILSSVHPDTLPAAAVRGDVIVGNATPKWARLAKGAVGWLLGYDANDVLAINPSALSVGNADTVDGQHAGAFAPAAHDLLSATHDDTNPAAAVRGDIIIADDTPEWVRLPVGGATQVLSTDGTDVFWDDLPASGNHDILSATHPDALTAAVVRGDIIVGNSTPKWSRKAKSAAGLLLGYDANDVVAINPNTLDVDKVDGEDAAAFVHLAGQLGGTTASPDVRGVRETSGPTLLTMGAVSAGQFLRRVGANVVGATMPDYHTINYDPDSYPASPDALDDEFDDGAVAAKWTKVNDPGLTEATYVGFILAAAVATVANADLFSNLIRFYQAPPADNTTWTIAAKVALTSGFSSPTTSIYMGPAVYLADTVPANPTFVGAGHQISAATSDGRSAVAGLMDNGAARLTNMTNTIATYFDMTDWLYVALRKAQNNAYTAANRYEAYFSFNGIVWFLQGYCTKTFANTPAEVGFWIRKPDSVAGGDVIIDWFRKIA